MSTPSGHLSLHLKLDELRNRRTPDSSGANRHAASSGDVALVHDASFGPCLRFDGGSGFLAVSDPFANPAAFTIALWVQAEGLSGDPNFHGLLGKQGDQWRKPGLWWIKGGLHYDSHDPRGARFNGTIPDFFVDPDEWVHIAWVKDGASYRLYRDGVLVATAPAPATIYSAPTDYWIGKVDSFWRGRMAAVRVYGRALSAAEIWQVTEADRVVPFRASHPIDFELRNEHGEHVLAIAEHPGGPGHDMELAISNTAGRPIVLRPLANATPSATNCHFTLRFRRGVLSAAAAALQLADSDGWKASAPQTLADRVEIYLLHTHSAPWPLAPGQTEVLTLRPLSAAAAGGARSARVELLTRQMSYDGAADGDTIEETRSHLLSIVNQRGKQNVPLHVGFVGPNQVLNIGALDTRIGHTERGNKLRLRIANMLRLDPAYPERSVFVFDAAADAPSRLVLNVPMEPEDRPNSMPWALGRSSELAAMTLALWIGRRDHKGRLKLEQAPADLWDIASQTLGTAREWTLIAKKRLELKSGECIEIELNDIISTLPAGLTDLTLHYHLPGCWDGQFVVPIEKSALHFLASRDAKTGADQPQGVLIMQPEVQGIQPQGLRIALPEAKGAPLPGVRISGGQGDNARIELRSSGAGTPYLDFAQQPDVDYDARLRLLGPHKLVLEGANLGIGVEPVAALDVYGHVLVRGDVQVSGQQLLLGRDNHTHGDTGLSRALVKDSGGRLTINYEQDFKGGVTIDGPRITLSGYVGVAVEPLAALDVNGDVRVRGHELSIGFANHAHGDTGLSRALAKDSGGRLTINYEQDFKGGVTINGPQITLNGNVGIGVEPAAALDVNGNMLVRGHDLFLGRSNNARGDTGLSRALVKDNGRRLTINYASDFGGGVTINGPQIALNGNVGIGVADTRGYKLAVNGTAGMRKLVLNENYEAADDNVLNVRGNTPETKPLIWGENRGRGWTFYAHSQHGRHYGNNSSIRMKEQVAPIADALRKIRQLAGVSFVWKGSGIADLGFIAEDAGRVLPEAVTYEADGYASGMSYDHVIPVLVEAVKEQQLIIERLLARLDAQEQ
jgi:hypothetical protein